MWKLIEKSAAFSLVYALPQTRTVQHIRIRVLYSTTPVPDQTSAAATMIGTGIRLQFLTKSLGVLIHAHEDRESVATILMVRTILAITKGEECTRAAAKGHMIASGSSFSYHFKAPFRDTESVS